MLICFCTLYAVKTRNLPENFNEAKFIGFAMYATCIIWLAFLVLYFGGPSPHRPITMSLSFSCSASVPLVLLFFQKLYIILFQPQRNTRSYAQTARNIRVHYQPTTTTASAAGVAAASASLVGDRKKSNAQQK